MNNTKTEFIIFGISNLLRELDLDSITVGGETVNSSQMVKFLHTTLDETLSFRKDVAARAESVFYCIHLIKCISKYLTLDSTKLLMCALVPSQLDYINCILTSVPCSTTKPYQKVQNQTAQIIYKSTKWTSATSCMKLLCWLPIRYSRHFKLLTTVYWTLHWLGPMYLRNRLKIKNYIRHTRQSSSTTLHLDTWFKRNELLQIEDLAICLPNSGRQCQTISNRPTIYNNSKTIKTPFF